MTHPAAAAPLPPTDRATPLDLPADQFRALGHALIDRIADLWHTGPTDDGAAARPATVLAERSLPATGEAAGVALAEAAALLLDGRLHSGDPRFHGYIRPAPAPIGVLGELLAAAANHNLSLRHVAPTACAVEEQTVGWLAALVGYPAGCGGLLTSGGTLANLSALLVARQAALADARQTAADRPPLTLYAARTVHGWLHKAVDAAGLPRSAVRWIACDAHDRLDPAALAAALAADRAAGGLPLAVIATAGTVATGSTDPLPAIAAVCRQHGAWFHVDGAYGAPAACLLGGDRHGDGAPPLAAQEAADLRGLALADSLALDPHKWLSAPLDAGCLLVRDARRLPATFAETPSYYVSALADHGAERPDFHQLGLENSRGLRALKVWLALRMAGRDGYRQLIADDIGLAQRLFDGAAGAGLEAVSRRLSIVTLRHRPAGWPDGPALDARNRALLARVQASGQAFLSPAVVNGQFLLRACFVNFRTTAAHVDALLGLLADHAAALDR